MRSHPEPTPNEEPCGLPPAAPAVFTNLYRQHVAAVYRYFYHQIGHVQDAEDLTATTFTRALSTFAQYEPERGSRPAWLFGVAHHCLQDHRRHWRAFVGPLPPGLVDPQPLPEFQLVSAERAVALQHAVRGLRVGQRDALMLHFFGGLQFAEVAAALGRSEGAVKMLVQRAVKALRDCSSLEDLR
jgi:RNA polymerase sigma-70 factor (ECF subfamily)